MIKKELFKIQHEILLRMERINTLSHDIEEHLTDAEQIRKELNKIRDEYEAVRKVITEADCIDKAVYQHNIDLGRDFVEDYNAVLSRMEFVEKQDDFNEIWIDKAGAMYMLEFGEVDGERCGVRVEYLSDPWYLTGEARIDE